MSVVQIILQETFHLSYFNTFSHWQLQFIQPRFSINQSALKLFLLSIYILGFLAVNTTLPSAVNLPLLYDDQDSEIGSIAFNGSEVAVCSHSVTLHINYHQKEEIHVLRWALTRRNRSDRFSNFLLETATYLHSDKPVYR